VSERPEEVEDENELSEMRVELGETLIDRI